MYEISSKHEYAGQSNACYCCVLILLHLHHTYVWTCAQGSDSLQALISKFIPKLNFAAILLYTHEPTIWQKRYYLLPLLPLMESECAREDREVLWYQTGICIK